MKRLILDASAGLKLVVDEPFRPEVRRLVADRIGNILVPWFFWLEVVNVLARRLGADGRSILEAVYELEQAGLETVAPGRAEILQVIDLVERHSLTAYDACYLALALSSDADLATADDRLAAAAGDRAILVGGRGKGRISEEPATFGQPTWPRWHGSEAYLADLRARTVSEGAR